MEFNDLISSRLGGKDFYQTSYYKFEKYSNYKKDYILNNPEKELLDFGIGESDDLPFSYILDTLSKEIFKYENNIYADNGIDKFKIAAAYHLKETYNLEIKEPLKQINHVMGAKSALTLIPLAFINKDDIVISTTPGYEVLANLSQWLNAKIYKVSLLKQNNYLPDLDTIPEEIYKKTKIFIINYPNNPTGAIANKAFYEKIIEKAIKYNFIIVNDNTYGPLTYNKTPLSIMSVKDAFSCCIEIHSCSKIFNMTGMRLGFIVGDEKIIDILKKVKDNVDSGQYIPIQLAASIGYFNQKKFLERLRHKYLTRMKNVAKILNKYNLNCQISPATFYLYVSIPKQFKSADEFAKYLLNNAGIFVIPWDEVEASIRLSMTFKVKDSDENFYKLLENRLKSFF